MEKYRTPIANTLIILSLAALIHGLTSLYDQVELKFDPWLLVFAAGLFTAAGTALTLFLKFKSKLEVATILISLVVAFYAGNFVLELTGRNIFNIFETKIVREMATTAPATRLAKNIPSPGNFISPRPVDNRNPNDILSALREDGIDASFMYNSVQLLPLVANKAIPEFFPLSSRSNTVTLLCNEGDQREFPIIRTDRYGFNNDDTIYSRPDKMILIVGDSFAQGSCVHQEQSVAGVLRRNGYPAVSTGIGGFGPILTLASLKEYGEKFKPQTVLWFYFDGNDITDLHEKGLRSRFALRYLKDDFSQSLITRQSEVDEFWKSGIFREAIKKFESDENAQEAWKNTLVQNLPLVRRLTGLMDLESLSDDESLVRIFSKIISTAKRRVEAWGGKLYFVVIPNKDDYHGRVPKYRFPVMSRIQKLGIPIIDVDAAIRKAGDPLQFFPVRNDWGHFNPAGYRLFAYQVIAALEGAATEPPRPLASPQGAAAPVPQPAIATYKPTGDIRLEYASYGQTSSVIPDDETRARGTDGASILGYGFIPESTTGTVQINVNVNAYSQTDNELVLAIFLSGRDRALKLSRIKLSAGKRAFLDISIRLPFASQSPMKFDIRVGPARPGTIYINGNPEGKESGLDLPYLSIAEIAGTDQGKPEIDRDEPTGKQADRFPLPQRWSRFWRQQYSGPGETASVMATQLSSLKATQGLKVLGVKFQPTARSGNLRVRVAMNAFASEDNILVVGLFRGSDRIPAGLATARLPGGKSTYLIESFELKDLQSLEELSVRVGPGRPGSIFINGDGKGGRQRNAFYPVLTIAEPATPATTEMFPEDDGSLAFAQRQNLMPPQSDPSLADRQEVACGPAVAGSDTGVFVTFGQSQAANTGDRKFQSKRDVINFNFLDSKCYPAIDPLLGASNLKGSLWSRLGDRLVESGRFDRVVFAPVAVGGTFLSEWMPGGQKYRRLSLALQRLRRANAKVTAFLWQQGEAESALTDMSAEDYKKGFLEMLSSIRRQGFSAPVYVAVSTYCGSGTERNMRSIRRALMGLAKENADILPGPDTDRIGVERRYDGCHFDGPGQDLAAGMWAEKILAR